MEESRGDAFTGGGGGGGEVRGDRCRVGDGESNRHSSELNEDFWVSRGCEMKASSRRLKTKLEQIDQRQIGRKTKP